MCPGSSHVYLCAGGEACDTPVASKQCSANNFCPTGTIRQRSCNALSRCSVGQSSPDYGYTFIWTFSIVMVFLFLVLAFGQARDNLRDRRQALRDFFDTLAEGEAFLEDEIMELRTLREKTDTRLDLQFIHLGLSLRKRGTQYHYQYSNVIASRGGSVHATERASACWSQSG